jgi:hypothetical protein
MNHAMPNMSAVRIPCPPIEQNGGGKKATNEEN